MKNLVDNDILIDEYQKVLEEFEKIQIEFGIIKTNTTLLKKQIFEGKTDEYLVKKLNENLALYEVYLDKFEKINEKIQTLKNKYNIDNN